MLQIILLILFSLATPALAQDGVVTSMSRSGGVPQYLLDKLNALESQYNTINTTLSSYTATVVTNPASCSTSTVYSGTCQTPTSARRLSEVSVTSTTSTGDLTAYGASGMVTRVHGFLNASSGCPTASGWSFCTTDQLRQAQALRITGYSPASATTSYFFSLDPGYQSWIPGGADYAPESTSTTSCLLMTSSSSASGYTRPRMGFNSAARFLYLHTNTICGTAVSMFCCKTQ